jgi:uncharacterized SAM-binding protein YcdF (DUF218 family)
MIAILILFLGWLVLIKKTKGGRRLVGLGLLVLALCSWGPISSILIIPLENRISEIKIPATVDGIIVLGGGIRLLENGEAQLGALNRIIQGLKLAREYPQSKLLLAGGSSSLTRSELREADYMKKCAEYLGISSDRILVERKSRNTHESAQEISDLLDREGLKRPDSHWILVTSAIHMPRAMGCFRRAGLNPIPYRVDYLRDGHYKIWPLFSPENIFDLGMALKEWLGLLTYRLSGFTNELFPK